MALFRFTQSHIASLPEASFAKQGVRERDDLQRLLRENIAIIDADILVISEEFCQWDDSRRRIDLLAIDREAKLVVLELKRDHDGGHMELQAIRYAAMVSRMSYERAIRTYEAHLVRHKDSRDARSTISAFLKGEEPNDDDILEVRIVLIAADFSKELTTAVLWLNEWELDIRCVRMKPYQDGGGLILDVQQVVPLPEAAEYQVSIRQEAVARRESTLPDSSSTGYWFMNTGQSRNDLHRSWDDCRKYGFMYAGGGPKWISDVRKLRVGDRLFAYLSGAGYVGVGVVTAEAVPMTEFIPAGQTKTLLQLPLVAETNIERIHDSERTDWCASVRWIKALPRENALLKSAARRSTIERINKQSLVDDLLKQFKVDPKDVA